MLGRAVDGDGRLAVVLGPPGIGKTSLLDAVGELGEARGARVLVARASELDRSFAFGVVRQLFERLLARPAGAHVLRAGARRTAAGRMRGDVLVELGTVEALLRAPGFEAHLAAAIPAAPDDASAAPIALLLADAHAAGGQLPKIAAALQLADERAASGSRLALTIEALPSPRLRHRQRFSIRMAAAGA